MRSISILVILLSNLATIAGTQDFIECNVLLMKEDVVYFDAGGSAGVAPGETFEIFFDDIKVAGGRIDWADDYVSRSERLDISVMASIYYSEGLKARITLFAAQANKGGFLSIPYYSDLDLEPRAINTPDEKTVGRLIHRGLLGRDIDGAIVPDLAGNFEVRGLTYTFYLDPDAHFHSGKPVEASDVAYSLERLALSPKLTSAGCYILAIKGAEEFRHRVSNEISGVYLINSKTVSITLKEPFPAFEDYLAGPGGYIVPRPGLEASGGMTIGAGDYRIKWRSADGLTLEPWGNPGSAAFLDSILFISFKNPDEAALSFELGRLDVITSLGEPPPKFIAGGKQTSTTTRTICAAVLGVNGLREYQKNLRFSRALTRLIDRDSIIRVILGGSGTIADDKVFGFDNNLSQVDPDSADYYLRRIEKRPASVSLFIDSHYPSLINVGRYIAGQLQNKGIKVVEKKVDLLKLEEDHTRSDIDLYLYYLNPVSADPDCVLYPLYSYSLSGQTNYLFDQDEALQVFLKRLRVETDGERREMLAAGLLQSIAIDPPAVILYEPYLTAIYRPDISGIRPLDQGYLDLRGAFIENK